MNSKSIAAVLLSSLLLTVSPAAAEDDLTLVLFGAQWCAPCRTELRELSALAQAAAPARIRLAWIDRAPTGLPSGAWSVVPPAEARRLFERSGTATRGLPMAALFSGDRACAHWQGPVTVAEVRRLKEACQDR